MTENRNTVQRTKKSVSDPVILRETQLAYCMMSTVLLNLNMCKISKEKQKEIRRYPTVLMTPYSNNST
jgi:hypothetical protein